MKKILLILTFLFVCSCSDEDKRLNKYGDISERLNLMASPVVVISKPQQTYIYRFPACQFVVRDGSNRIYEFVDSMWMVSNGQILK